MYLKKQTLQDDFGIWWDLPKYRNRDFEAKQYALTIGMCYELQDTFEKIGKDDVDAWHKLADNFFRFMMDFFPTEMTVMGCRVAINQYNLPFQPDKLKHFDEFYDRFGKYVAASNED